jgi:hypothetical protein
MCYNIRKFVAGGIFKLMKLITVSGMCLIANKKKSDARSSKHVPPQTQRRLQNTTYKHAYNSNPTKLLLLLLLSFLIYVQNSLLKSGSQEFFQKN